MQELRKKKSLPCTCVESGRVCRHCLFSLLGCPGMCLPACVFTACVNARTSSWLCQYAHATVTSLNAQPFLRRRVDSSLPACARMCVALICWMNADPSIKADLALCPSHRHVSDYQTAPRQLQGHHIHQDIKRNFKPRWLTEQLNRRRTFSANGRAACNHWNGSQ